MAHIEEINEYNLPDTKQVQDGYYWKTIPDISARNIAVLMDKLNEVIQTLNQLLPPG